MRFSIRSIVDQWEARQRAKMETNPAAVVSRLREGSTLRLRAERILAGDRQPVSDVEPIVDALSSLSPFWSKERQVAVWLLAREELSQEARLECLKGVCNVLVRNRPKGLRHNVRWAFNTFLAIEIFFLGAFLTAFLAGMVADVHGGISSLLLVPFICVFSLLPSAFAFVLLSPITYVLYSEFGDLYMVRLRPVISTIGAWRLPESISLLEKAAQCRLLRATATASLSAAVSTLTPDHYGTLGIDIIPSLCRILEKEYLPHEEVYAALAMVGDGQAIPVIQERASWNSRPALRLLPILMERREKEQESGILLRGACAPPAAPDQLLRAAAGATEVDPKQLLRASPTIE